jgi:hypothetical protein
MSSIPLPTRPARGRTQSTRPARRGGYRAALEAAEKRGREQGQESMQNLVGGLIKYASQRYWNGYAQGLTDFARDRDDTDGDVAREYAHDLAVQYAAEGVDTRDWTVPAGTVVPGTEVPDVEHLPCPAWCEDCERAEPGSPDHTRWHRSRTVAVYGAGELRSKSYAAEVTVERIDDGDQVTEPTHIFLQVAQGMGVSLTAPAARQLAAHLLNASDTVDGAE